MSLWADCAAVIVSCIALPKVCKRRFDITAKKEDDGYKELTLNK